jgi:hypothetical protein
LSLGRRLEDAKERNKELYDRKMSESFVPICALLNILSQKNSAIATMITFYLYCNGLCETANTVVAQFGFAAVTKTMHSRIDDLVKLKVLPRLRRLCSNERCAFIIDNVEYYCKVSCESIEMLWVFTIFK